MASVVLTAHIWGQLTAWPGVCSRLDQPGHASSADSFSQHTSAGNRQRSDRNQTGGMPTSERSLARAATTTTRQLIEIGTEFREARMAHGESQEFVGQAARLSRSRYSRIEAGRITTLSISELNRVAAVLGLDASVRLFPGGAPTRDATHAGKLGGLLRQAKAPLAFRLEVPLPVSPDRWEKRAWDAMLYGHGARTAIELEMRMRDVQAMRRRHALKRRDDPTEQFLLLVADTKHNRRVLAEFADLFADLPRLMPSVVRRALEAGQHPPTGLLLI